MSSLRLFQAHTACMGEDHKHRTFCLWLRHGQLVGGGIAAGHPVEQLALDIGQQTRRTDPEQFVVKPVIAKLLFDKNKPCYSILRSSYSSSGLESDHVASFFMVLPDGSAHN